MAKLITFRSLHRAIAAAVADRLSDPLAEKVAELLAPAVSANLERSSDEHLRSAADRFDDALRTAQIDFLHVAEALKATPETMEAILARHIDPVRSAQNEGWRLIEAALMQHPLMRMRHESHDVLGWAGVLAALESAQFYTEHMLTARAFATDLDLLRHAAALAPAEGLTLEFGVASGRTLTCLAEARGGTVHGFDSFDGLPEDWRTHFPRGTFAGQAPQVPDNAFLIKGLFAETLPAFLASHPGPVALLHVDCDLYSSTRDIFAAVGERLVSGSVIVFDEYFNYPGWKANEFRAFQEAVSALGLSYRYEGFVPTHQQVCVVIE